MNKSRKVWRFVVLLVMVASGFAAMASANIKSESDAKYSSATIYVPDNYTKIQDAVNAADSGDTIIVRDGTYTENVNVNKRLTIKSENGSANCIVKAANYRDYVFNVTVNYVNIKGFTVKRTRNMAGIYQAGIYLDSVTYCNISNNTLLNNWIGIHIYSSSNNIITNNNCEENTVGIRFDYSSNNILTNNTCSNNWCGVGLIYSSNNIITNNICNLDTECGISLYSSTRSTASIVIM